ncbi:MAG: TrkH family potassium uptake protein [Chloroflexota bacterium]
MNARPVFHLISFLLMMIAFAMAVCWLVSFIEGDLWDAQRGLAQSSAMICIAGLVLWLFTRGTIDLTRRDGIGIVTFGWLLTVACGALPFMLTGVIQNPVGALFESVSGFTTTGSSVLTVVESVPRGILFWRAMTQFPGGMGILVLCVAILPFLGAGGMQIFRAEMSGPSKDRLTPRITSTAKLLWGVYIILNAGLIVLLKLGGMSWFDACCHAFATVATGGFSTMNTSIGSYHSLYIEMVTVVFMLLGGTNAVLLFRLLRGNASSILRDTEFRLFISFWLIACGLVTLDTWRNVYGNFGEALRNSAFSTASILTTTGFATADFNRWPIASKLVLVLIALAGGCAGSTAGGLKQIRILIVIKAAIREIRLFMQPQAVLHVKVGKDSIDHNVVMNIGAFSLIYVLTFGLLSLVMTYFLPNAESALTSVVGCMTSTGPGMGQVGPMGNYAGVPDGGKIVLICAMLLGRLEFYSLLAVLQPSFWRK